MTKRHASAPSTADLYAGAPLLDQCIASDLQAYLRASVKGLPSADNVRVNRGHDALGEIFIGLWKAANAYIFATRDARAELFVHFRILVMQLETALLHTQAIVTEDLDPTWDVKDDAAHDLAARLAIYVLEAGRIEGVPYAQPFARDYGRSAPGGPAALFALGLTLASQRDVWFRPSLAATPVARETVVSLIREARRVLRLPEPPVPPASQIEDDDSGTDWLTLERSGIVRMPPTLPEAIAQARATIPPGRCVVVAELGNLSKSEPRKDATAALKGVVGETLPLVPVPTDWGAWTATLDEKAPHAARAIRAIRDSQAGRRYWGGGVICLDGPPGAGKTRLVRIVAEVSGLPYRMVSCENSTDSSMGGTAARWQTGHMSDVLALVASSLKANGVIHLDELEKASGSRRSNGGCLWDTVLGLWEPETSCRWQDPFIAGPIDVSNLLYLCTTNGVGDLPGPMRDRMRIVPFPAPGREHLATLAPQVAREVCRRLDLDEVWSTLDGEEYRAIEEAWGGGSIRRLTALVETIFRVRDLAPVARH